MIMVYKDVITNVGEQYFPSLGAFMCHDENYYILLWSVTTSPEKNRSAELRLMTAKENFEKEVRGRQGIKDWQESDQNARPRTKDWEESEVKTGPKTSEVVHCEPGRAFYIKAVTSDSDSVVNTKHTTFSGYRLPSDICESKHSTLLNTPN